MNNLTKTIILWVLKLIPAGIMLQTIVLFKFANNFNGHTLSQELFQKMSDFIENIISQDVFRIGTGVLELIASVLLLIPKTAKSGALLTIVVMLGAIASHIIGPLGTKGAEFPMAIVVTASALIYLVLSKKWNKA